MPGPDADASVILRASGLTIAYGAAAPIVDGLDITIRQGEVVGLLGESGCGKSTAAYALLGLARPPGRIMFARSVSRARIC